MLWRTPYSTRIVRNVAIPILTGVRLDGTQWEPATNLIIIGAFGLSALSEVGIWAKLLESAELESKILFFGTSFMPRNIATIESSFPPSSSRNIILVDDAGGSWGELIQPDRPERAFAAHLIDQTADPLMIGAPTEDAWELFQDLVNFRQKPRASQGSASTSREGNSPNSG